MFDLNSVTVDGATRFVAYMGEGFGWRHFECVACGAHETTEKPYFYVAADGGTHPLCYGCVRGDGADPRFIWWAEARRLGLLT